MSEGFNNFIFYKEWLNQIRLLACSDDPNDILSLCDGLETFLEGQDPDGGSMTLMATLVYNQMTAQIARDKGTYKEVQQARSEAGKKGAEARWNKAKQDEATDSKAMANDGKTWQMMANDGLKEDVDVDDDVSPNGDSCIAGAEPLIGLPLNDGTEHQVTQEDLNEYAALYPAVNVMQELRDMRGWLLANPSRKKTKRGIKAFIRTWLSKEQDKPRSSPHKLTAAEITQLPFIDPFAELREARP